MFKLFFVTFVLFALFILGLGIGLFFGRRPIKGSCGGLGAIMGEPCSFCERKGQCQRKKHREAKAS